MSRRPILRCGKSDRRETVQAQTLPVPDRAHHSAESDGGALEITVLDSLAPLEVRWRELDHDNLNSLHQGIDWCMSWAKAHANPLSIVWGRLGAETAFILPVEINSFHG